MSVFVGTRRAQEPRPEARVDCTADILARAAERRLAAANHVLAELRTAFPTALVVTTRREESRRPEATPEPVPAHLQRYADEVDRWHLEARAARAARGPEGR